MENPCTIVFFGDSITIGYVPIFEIEFKKKYPEIDLTIINAGIEGETTRNGLDRIQSLLDKKPTVAVIGFGMNDWTNGIELKEYRNNLVKMIDLFQNIGTRVILNTINPSYNFKNRHYNKQVDFYSEEVRNISYEKRIKVADINALWKSKLRQPKNGLRDDKHPNIRGYKIICKALMWIVPRCNTTVLWQFNGHAAKCNFRCPYCYYIGLHHAEDRFTGNIDQWHERFLEAFGNQHLVFYLAFGEPTFGSHFLDILSMVDSESNWELRMTSNVSYNQENIVKSHAAIENRLNINASFHPCMVDRQKFLKRILFLRDHGIEVPIVYVAYPPYLKSFEDDIHFFSKHGFVVHVRRFIGNYRGKRYPWAYTQEELDIIIKYSDDGTIRYMLNQQVSHGKNTFSGLHFFVVDNAGNVGYDIDAFAPYTALRGIFGNIHTGNFCPALLPTPFPGYMEGTVDGVANIVEAGYKELEHNNVLSFAAQGGVYKDKDGKVIYGNLNKSFSDPSTRASYNFSPRNLIDFMAYNNTMKKQLLIDFAKNSIRPIYNRLRRK